MSEKNMKAQRRLARAHALANPGRTKISPLAGADLQARDERRQMRTAFIVSLVVCMLAVVGLAVALVK